MGTGRSRCFSFSLAIDEPREKIRKLKKDVSGKKVDTKRMSLSTYENHISCTHYHYDAKRKEGRKNE